jgi:pimeloyl-ACP methyl ester carboxylesterase
MAEGAFEELYEQLQRLYQAGNYAEALRLATDGLKQYPDQRTSLDYWRMTMAARTGDTAQTIQVLKEALEQGQWYSELLLRRSPSFKALQGDPEFERLVSLNQEVAENEHKHAFPIFTLRQENHCQHGGPACRLLMGLHSNAGTVNSSLGFWRPAASAGWLVAAPQSSQAIWKDAYVWDDRETAEAEIQSHYATLRRKYAVDPAHTVLAGHSMGGEIAIWLALRGAIGARGFLAIGPGGPYMDDLAEWEPLLHQHSRGDRSQGETKAEMRGYVVVGEKDTSIPHERIKKLVKQMNVAGIQCKLESLPGEGHDYSAAFDEAILRALKYLDD